ncbi:flavin monoamine oxidase family protein [Nonlabens ponticola]|uniref:FAD-dependent oxidoreductase n=1 Tax=Nonlabens ponticola TaxID=2496866 RepID=A0A3S9MYM1_9FLAO|nr:FAD-dependent oxidoreductase [Nonlabens ponticola]AZQ44153.1 FAD-dependent oxidoreductase [Nonlabens ponticola]
MSRSIIILGAGLTGLSLAYKLQQQGIEVTILESRDRVGGRIFTKMSGNHTPIDLGAAWFWSYNREVLSLIDKLGLKYEEQHMDSKVWYKSHPGTSYQLIDMPANQPASYRLRGGSSNLILSLNAVLKEGQVKYNTTVQRVVHHRDTYQIHTNDIIYNADVVINTIPPQITASAITFEPSMPINYLYIARRTQTWMEDSVKFGLGFKSPFWKEKGIPATAFSNSGPIAELYDYSHYPSSRFALMGFVHPTATRLPADERKKVIVDQLAELLGIEVHNYISFELSAWNEQPSTNPDAQNLRTPHENNGHPILRQSLNGGTLIMAGSETSDQHAGYMEGALRSAQLAFEQVLSLNIL